MINFKHINNIIYIEDQNIPLEDGWINVSNFKSKIISKDFKEISENNNYIGPCYKIIAKQTRKIFRRERLIRSLRGIWKIMRSFGKEWSSKEVNHLFYKNHENRYFKTLVRDSNAKDFTLLPEFTEEISLKIFSYLDYKAAIRCHRVNKKFKDLSTVKSSALIELCESLGNGNVYRLISGINAKRYAALVLGDVIFKNCVNEKNHTEIIVRQEIIQERSFY